jgi:hypothetical protein
MLRPLKSLLPTADDVVNSDLPTLGGILLVHLKSYEGLNTVYQHAGLIAGISRRCWKTTRSDSDRCRRKLNMGPASRK